jgi:hypothetical protein
VKRAAYSALIKAAMEDLERSVSVFTVRKLQMRLLWLTLIDIVQSSTYDLRIWSFRKI